MAITALEVSFINLSLDQLPLLLKTQWDHLNKWKNNEFMVVQEKPSSNNVPIKPKPFKKTFNGRFKKNAGFQKPQGNAIKYFKCRKPGHIQRNYESMFTNNSYPNSGRNNNKRQNHQGQNKDIVCSIKVSFYRPRTICMVSRLKSYSTYSKVK